MRSEGITKLRPAGTVRWRAICPKTKIAIDQGENGEKKARDDGGQENEQRGILMDAHRKEIFFEK